MRRKLREEREGVKSSKSDFFFEGGNAVLMANALAKKGWSTFHSHSSTLTLTLHFSHLRKYRSYSSSFSRSFSPTLSLSFSSIFLGGPVGSGLRPFLSPNISLPKGEGEKDWKDEVHLILEYKKEEEWGGEKAPRANRVILTHDVNNIHLTGGGADLERTIDFKSNLAYWNLLSFSHTHANSHAFNH